MAKAEEIRDYKMGDDELMQKTDLLTANMQRDAADFLTRKIDATRIAEVVTINDKFKNLPTDEELRGLITTAVETKDATALDVRQKISTIRSMAITKWGENGKYKTFAFGSISELGDDDLFRTAKRVARVATKYLTDLATEGLTTTVIADLTTAAGNLDKNIDDVGTAEENRNIAAQDRVHTGNAVYKFLATYADVGKSLYEFSNPAKYNDYVLYDAPPPPPKDTGTGIGK